MTTEAPAYELKDLKAAYAKAGETIAEGMKLGVKVDGENVELSSNTAETIRAAVVEAKKLKDLIEAHQFAEEIKAWGEKPATESAAMSYYAKAQQLGLTVQRPSVKSLGHAFVESKEFKDFQATGRYTMDTPFTMEAQDVARMGHYGQKDVYGGMVPDTVNPQGWGQIQFDPIVPRAQRQYRVRDLFPVAQTSANLIDFFRVVGFAENGGEGNAAPVPDRTVENSVAVFGPKPKSNLQFNTAQAAVRTIAHWEAAHRNVIQDVPQLQSIINNELLYGLALREDDQLLNGDGTGENLLGLLNTPGVQAYTMVSGDQKSDALRRSATLSIIANYPGTGFVLHPLDWEDVELQKGVTTGGGDGQYMLVTNIAIGAQAQVWRQPVVETPAMNQGTWLTGAFGLGAQVYDRQQASVRIAEQHEDFFVRNAIAVLVEERITIACKRPESFIVGTFL